MSPAALLLLNCRCVALLYLRKFYSSIDVKSEFKIIRMKYFKLDFSLNKKEIGNYPQIQDFKKGYDDDRKETCSQIARYYFGKRPDMEIDFDCLELANKARLTDYISSSYLNSLTGLLVSDNLFSFFSGLRMVSYISYKAPIYQKGNLLSVDYEWIHFIEM